MSNPNPQASECNLDENCECDDCQSSKITGARNN